MAVLVRENRLSAAGIESMNLSGSTTMTTDQRAKVLVVIGTLAHMGGAERQALYLVDHLSKLKGCEPSVLTFRDGSALGPSLEALGIAVHVLPYHDLWSRTRRARALAGLLVLLRRLKPDAILPIGSPASKAMGLVLPWSGAGFCWWNQQDEGRGLTGTDVERRILNRMSCITSNSVAGKDFLSRTYGLAPEQILVYNNGTPLPDSAEATGEWRRKLGLGRRKIVTMIANLTSFKDHGTLFDAWPEVRDHFPGDEGPVLLLAGSLGEKVTVAKMKTKAFDLGLSSDDVRFLGAVDDIPSLILDSDLIVHSSLKEGCPNAVCEAMSLSRAVIATDIPGCRQALGDADCLVAPSDPKALARGIIALLENEALRTRKGQLNRERIATQFSMEGMNRFFQEEFERGLGRSLS